VKAWFKKVKGYLVAAAVGAVVIGLVLVFIAFPKLWPAMAGIGGGLAGLASLFLSKKKTDAQKEAERAKRQAEILASDPQHSVDSLPDDIKQHADTAVHGIVTDAVDDTFTKYGNRDPDPGAASGGVPKGRG
jgi:hypothetical protein